MILYATDLSEATEVSAAGHVLDYGEVTVSRQPYLLPVRSVAFVRSGIYETREEIEYRNYRKFSGEAIINFTADPDVPIEPAPH